MERLIAIGDVHGCVEELALLYRQIEARSGDRFVFLGDLIDRGPESSRAVRLVGEIIENHPGSVSILGNHEAKLARLLSKGGRDALPEHLATLTDEELDWLVSLPLYARDQVRNVVFVHGGFFSDYFTRYGALPMEPSGLASVSRKQRDRAARFVFVRRENDDGCFVGLRQETPEMPRWAERYDGREGYGCFGHEPFVDAPRWFDNAVGIDGGCVFGGELLAAIWGDEKNERPDIVGQTALRKYAERRFGG